MFRLTRILSLGLLLIVGSGVHAAQVQVGDTIEQVEAVLGKPTSELSFKSKVILIYDDVKVHCLNGIVRRVEVLKPKKAAPEIEPESESEPTASSVASDLVALMLSDFLPKEPDTIEILNISKPIMPIYVGTAVPRSVYLGKGYRMDVMVPQNFSAFRAKSIADERVVWEARGFSNQFILRIEAVLADRYADFNAANKVALAYADSIFSRFDVDRHYINRVGGYHANSYRFKGTLRGDDSGKVVWMDSHYFPSRDGFFVFTVIASETSFEAIEPNVLNIVDSVQIAQP